MSSYAVFEGIERPIVRENEHGRVRFYPISEPISVRDVSSKDLPKDCLFDIEHAERIAVITDNRGVQLSPRWPFDGWMYVVLHTDPSTVFPCRVEVEWYADVTAKHVIETSRRWSSFP